MREEEAAIPGVDEPLVDDATRTVISRLFRLLEDIIFVGLGAVLAICALYMLAAATIGFSKHLFSMTLNSAAVVELIEQLLLILLVVEILYTVQVSFREHTLAPEPFLLIGLIAAVRRVLVITAELAESRSKGEEVFRFLMIELGMLTFMIVALVASVMMLRRKPGAVEAVKHG